MKMMKKTAIAAVVALSASMTTYAEKVNIGDPGWTGATAIANLLSAVITDKMGGEVELVPGNNTAIYGAIDRSKGEIEVHPDVWLPNQQAYTNDLVPKGTLKLSSKSYEGNQGYCVSQAFAAEMDITSIFDLGRPEVVAAMDSDGNGKGEFWIGADGWASANVNEVKVRDYKLLDAGIEPVRAAEAVKNAKAGQVRYRNDKNGIIHTTLGKVTFEANQIQENLEALLVALKKAKPSQAKGVFIKKVTISTTMGAGVAVDQATLTANVA